MKLFVTFLLFLTFFTINLIYHPFALSVFKKHTLLDDSIKWGWEKEERKILTENRKTFLSHIFSLHLSFH